MAAEGDLPEEPVTAVHDRDRLRWLVEMCRTGEGCDESPRPTSRPPAHEYRHSVVSSLPPLRLEEDEARLADDDLDAAWGRAAPEPEPVPEGGGRR